MDLMALEATLTLNTEGFETGLATADRQFNSFADSVLRNVAKVQLAIGKTLAGAVKDFIGDVFTTGYNFDKAMAGVYAVTDATDEASQQQLRQNAILEAAGSSFNTADTAAAQYYAGLAGWDLDEITSGVHGIIKAAEASGEPLKKVSDIITDTISAYGAGADESMRYADVFAATATSSNTTITQMGDALKYVGPVAHMLGYDIEDTATAIGVLSDNSIKGSQAGTSLRNIMTRIATNAGATETKLGALDIVTQKLGVQFNDAEDNARPFVDFLEDCREAWHALDDEDKNAILDTVSEVAGEATTADDIINSLTDDIELATQALVEWGDASDPDKQKEYEQTIRDLAGSYKELFDALGMDINPDTDSIESLIAAMEQAKTKFTGLNDEQETFYAHQIGGQRAMSGWSALMESTADDFDKVKTATHNATGAAERMSKTRLGSTLSGDVDTLMSKFDALKTAIYDCVDDDLREGAQGIASALEAITLAVQKDGLEGGIDELARQLDILGDKLQPIFDKLGNGLVGFATAIIEKITPPLTSAAKTLGGALIDGIIEGLNSDKDSQSLGERLRFGFITDILEGFKKDGLKGAIINALTGGMNSELTIPVKPEVKHLDQSEIEQILTPGDGGLGRFELKLDVGIDDDAGVVNEIQAELDRAIAAGKPTVKINDIEFPTNISADQILDQLRGAIVGGVTTAVDEAGNSLNTGLDAASQSAAAAAKGNIEGELSNIDAKVTVGATIEADLGDAGQAGGAAAASNLEAEMSNTNVEGTLETDIGNAGKSGGSAAANSYKTEMSSAGTQAANGAASSLKTTMNTAVRGIAGFLSSALGGKGTEVGSKLASGIQSSLSSKQFTINVKANVSGLPTHHNASAMAGGRIFNHPTIFGYADGAFQVAGDAGPEAVVGVNSLHQMIVNAVRGAAAGGLLGARVGGREMVIPRTATRPIEITVKLADDTVLARAIHRMNAEEEQRIGPKLVMGVR